MALVLELYSSQGQHTELLSILNSDKLGILNSPGFDRVAMIKEKLRILETQQQWAELGDFCKYLIESTDTLLDMEFDWRVLESICLAIRNVDNK
jgi:hypothetical protein